MFQHLFYWPNFLNFKIGKAISQEQPLQITKNDLEFHQYIWKKSENNILYNTLTQIVTPLFYISLNMQNLQHWTTKMTSIVSMHEKYLSAIKNGGKKQINSAILSHARDSVLIFETSKTDQKP
jgi:DNA-binding FadR family transcriptional regulator